MSPPPLPAWAVAAASDVMEHACGPQDTTSPCSICRRVAAALVAERERCARALCLLCASDVPLFDDGKRHRQWVPLGCNCDHHGHWAECKAAAIRTEAGG